MLLHFPILVILLNSFAIPTTECNHQSTKVAAMRTGNNGDHLENRRIERERKERLRLRPYDDLNYDESLDQGIEDVAKESPEDYNHDDDDDDLFEDESSDQGIEDMAIESVEHHDTPSWVEDDNDLEKQRNKLRCKKKHLNDIYLKKRSDVIMKEKELKRKIMERLMKNKN